MGCGESKGNGRAQGATEQEGEALMIVDPKVVDFADAKSKKRAPMTLAQTEVNKVYVILHHDVDVDFPILAFTQRNRAKDFIDTVMKGSEEYSIEEVELDPDITIGPRIA
jgi:hypothetical protein